MATARVRTCTAGADFVTGSSVVPNVANAFNASIITVSVSAALFCYTVDLLCGATAGSFAVDTAICTAVFLLTRAKTSSSGSIIARSMLGTHFLLGVDRTLLGAVEAKVGGSTLAVFRC